MAIFVSYRSFRIVLLFWMLTLSFIQGSSQNAPGSFLIPLGGNTWSNRSEGGSVTNDGITGWTDPQTSFTLYFRVTQPGSLHLWLHLAVPSGKSRIRVSPGGSGALQKDKGRAEELEVTGTALQRYDAGAWTIRDTGYQSLRIEGLRKSGSSFAAIQSIEIQGSVLNGQLSYVRSNEGNFFHWGRRGPSVHLAYDLPAGVHAEWFYNEVTVPAGQDIQGSYFMADGFGEGYFGMQVNSPTERHILFSVWSPFQTDNPTAIPDSLQIILAKKGEGVHAGAFGNEGAGGQSWLNYPWKAGDTYRFLLHARPIEKNYTQFTAWWYAPEQGKWLLIASFKRPQTQKWLSGLHSFLENFEPETGDRQRYVLFNHQWVRDEQGNWISLNKARFTGDNTARKGYRMDYGGGIKGDAFYLQNCGFFNTYTPLDSRFGRPAGPDVSPPDIDLAQFRQ
jgi:hypothetical protein